MLSIGIKKLKVREEKWEKVRICLPPQTIEDHGLSEGPCNIEI